MHAHLDAVGGIAGDMFIGACVDAWPDLEVGLEQAVRAVGLPADWRIEIGRGKSNNISGIRVGFVAPSAAATSPTGTHAAIRDLIETSDLDAEVAQRALQILGALAQAEAKVHDIAVDDVHFHEIADWDSIADIVGAAWIIENCGATSWSVSPLPIGGGTVATSHGHLPVPAPATALLLEGFATIDDGCPGERVTPTGAAILAHLGANRGPGPGGVIAGSGHGLGTRQLPDRPNVLRLLAFDDGPSDPHQGWVSGTVSTIAFEVDDQTAEDIAIGVDRLRADPCVLDVTQGSVLAKKGRVATSITVMCRPSDRDHVIEACFAQTTTIGLRWHDQQRAELPRAVIERNGVTGKSVTRPDGTITTKPEIDQLAANGHAHVERATVARRFNAGATE